MPREYHATRIALAKREIRWALARRLTDPTSAAYMRDCIRYAIRHIRQDRAALRECAQ